MKWYGDDVVEAIYKGPGGALGTELLYRDREPTLQIVESGRPWSFTGDGNLLRLVSEAHRIRLAYLFDPVLAVHTSLVEPLPHQITAVYEEMLTRQPLRFLLADDPGAGKTIMAGLFIKELRVRGDLRRCMIVAPGNLVEQWQDELSEKFQLPFEIMTNDKFESARTGNWFEENPLVICRLDKLSRNQLVQEKLSVTDWDLVVVDEAHKMSASYFSGEIKETKRYKLGKQLSGLARHFLLMSATPHNGKEEDFQLFMALLDGDRFEGKFRDGVHVCDNSDMMRRMVKEQLVKFDETPLFPERRAYTVNYELSDEEAALYKDVSDYVREEFNRADALQNDGRKGTVGFALTILQRRLASSPEAIYQSLRRRRERLEKRLREEKFDKRGAAARLDDSSALPSLRNDDDILDFEDSPGDELEDQEESIVDQATAARTIAELELEVDCVKRLEEVAEQVRRSGTDKKWEELSSLLQDNEHMFDAHGHRRKLVIFTEHRDTLRYLAERIRTLLGDPDALVTISGGMLREERRNAQDRFTQDRETLVLVATDAAGEGINLQRAHLMVNYDLPWNPNRLEQRFNDSLFDLAPSQTKPWLGSLGRHIARVQLDDPEEQTRIQELGRRLAATRWQVATGLESTPYIDGEPAGTPRRADVLWKETNLYVEDQPLPHLFQAITRELSREFSSADIAEAIGACVERTPDFIAEYFDKYFTLLPPDEEPALAIGGFSPPAKHDSLTAVSEQPAAFTVGDNEEQFWEDEFDPADDTVRSESLEKGQAGPTADQEGPEIADSADQAAKRAPKKSKPALIELVARNAGFRKDGSGRYCHPDGGWIQKTAGDLFPWKRHAAGGELIQSYWTKECCLHRDGLEIDAALWKLCEKFPEQYSLVVRDLEDRPLVLTGNDLSQLRESGRLNLHAATYRLVYETSD